MSFYTSLTGLNGAQADIAAISNNIANVGTTGFKRSRAEFGDIFATSPLQANSSAVGSGTIMKSIKQQFTQGNIESSLNALDLSISGQGFFALKPSLTSTQTVYTRNGAFSVNNDRYVVDAQGQLLQVFPVNADGSVIATGISSAKNLQLPTTSGLPKASQTIQLGLNLPADATIIPNSKTYNESNPYVFDKTNPATYNQSTSITIYDSLGNATIATIYYVKTSNATETSPTNKWQTHVFVGDREVTPQLITAKDDQSRTYYINKFGQITTAPQSVDPTFNAGAAHPLYKQDDQIDKTPSTAASVVGGIIKSTGFDFGDTDAEPVTIITDPKDFFKTRESGDQSAIGSNPPYWGRDMFSVTVDGSAPQSVSIRAGTYTGTQLAAEMTRAVNEKFGGQHYFSITDTYRKDGGAVVPGNDIIKLNLSRLAEDGSSVSMTDPIEIDLLGAAGSAGTPPVGGATTAENKLQLTREQLVNVAQQKLNDALNKRHLEFGKPSTWPDAATPPIKVGYDVASRSFTFTVATNQLGPDANEPESRFNSIQVYNPTDSVNDLGIYPQTTSPDTLIRANTLWSGTAALPGGDPIVDPREQRTGIQVAYNKDTRQFTFSSGSTGEASSITVGRALLAGTPDIQPQVNSYDVSTMDFSVDHKVNLEINGRQLTYDYIANGNSATSSAKFFAGIEQKCPVTISDFEEVSKGSSTSSEVQTFRVYGKIMKDDKFQINLAPFSGQSPVTLTVGPLTTITSTMTTSERLNALTTAIQSAITAYNAANTTDIAATVTSSSNLFTVAYTGFGLVSSMVGVKQTQRGSDSGLTPLPLTDATVQADLPDIVNGTVTTPSIQTIALKSAGGLTPTFNIGDIYRFKLPLADGSVKVKDVTLTAATLTDLRDKLNAAGFGAVTFTSIATGSKIVATYNNNGPVTGAISVEQIAVGPTPSYVRPEAIGPFTIGSTGTNLEVTGDPAGTPFKLNMRIDGVVKTMSPIGSQGSTSRAGLEIGQAKSVSFLGNNDLLGIGEKYTAMQRFVAGTGLAAQAATAVGTRGVTPMSQTFMLNEALGENRMTFTIDGIVGTISLPIRAYTGDTFASAIQDRVNQIEDPKTGRIVSGVTVKFDADNNRLIFTSGTTGANSQINVVGHANFGLANVAQTVGSVPIITNLKQATDAQGNKLYVDSAGNITTQAPSSQQNWFPLYLQEGQLTFDTVGKLISPKEGVVYSPFDPQNGSDLLRLNIDYGKFSTQYSSPFSVLSLSQDGYPSGSLNGLDIDASGTIRANYTNGETAALGKIMVANFANANGLKQVGNATYVATSVSGQAVLGQAGADGFGTIKAGALERSNVDITQELVNLITAQRNFQANAKAIETTTTLSQTIIQIRG
mgnify:CR=1 FL=1